MTNFRERPSLSNALTRAVLILGTLAATAAHATTVTPMNVDRLSDLAGQVIVGNVAAVNSYWASDPIRIETEVIFDDVSFLKGELPDAPPGFALVVPGGTVGDFTMRIAGAPTFRVGEKRLLFLLPTYKTFPAVGVDQGAFSIRPDQSGVDRVYQSSGLPVAGFDSNGFVRTAKISPTRRHNLPRAIPGESIRPRPIAEAQPAPQPTTALSLDEFIQQISPALDASRDHQLSEPAGRRIPVQYIPVPLKSSPGQRARTNATTVDRARAAASDVGPSSIPPRGGSAEKQGGER